MEITQEPVLPKTRDMVNKGFAALERGNLDYAIDILTAALSAEPGCLRTRKYLRAAEIKKYHAAPSNHIVNTLSLLPQVVQTLLLIQARKYEEALSTAEKLLRKDPLSMPFVKLFGLAAEKSGFPEIAVQTLAMVREFYPQDIPLLTWLGELYLRTDQPRQARAIFEKLVESKPMDMQLLKDLKDATALDSMSKDGWASAGPDKDQFRKMLRDESQSVILEQSDKAVKTEDDVAALITDAQQKIAKEPTNINYRRNLANLYASRKEYDKAIVALEDAQTVTGSRDPQVDAAIAVIKLEQFAHEIERLEAAGDKAAAEAKRAERATFEFENLADRVTRYPNDLGLRFEYAMVLFERQNLNEAIQQFQLASRSPSEHVRAMYFIGQCFLLKKQYDLAADQFEKTVAEIPSMTDLRKEVVYDLGRVYEAMGDKERALEQFKSIYQVDYGFKDVAKKIDQGYAK